MTEIINTELIEYQGDLMRKEYASRKELDNKLLKIYKGNIKLTVFKEFPYEEMKKIIEAICLLGYECVFVDNGNIVFDKKEVKL